VPAWRWGKPHHVESADQVDFDDAGEFAKRHGAVAADDALGGTDAGAIDDDARRAVIGGGLADRRLGRAGIGHVARDGDAVDVDRHFGSGFGVDVDNGHFGAGLRQHSRRRCAKARTAAGYDRGMSRNIHDLIHLVSFTAS